METKGAGHKMDGETASGYENALLALREKAAVMRRLEEIEQELRDLHRISPKAILLAIEDFNRADNCNNSNRRMTVVKLRGDS